MNRPGCISAHKSVLYTTGYDQPVGRSITSRGPAAFRMRIWAFKSDVSLCGRCNLYLGLYSLFHRASDIKIDIRG